MQKLKAELDLLIVVGLGAFLRARVLTTTELWFDEAFSGLMAKLPWVDFLYELQHDTHPPLYSLLLRMWGQFAGVSDFTMRFPSLVCGVGLIVAVYYLCRRLADKETATIAAALIAINPFLITYSVEARSYSLYALVIVLATSALISKKTILFWLFISLAGMTHYFAAIFCVPLIAVYIWLIKQKTLTLKTELPKIAFGMVFISGVLVFTTVFPPTGANQALVAKPAFIDIITNIAAYMFGVQAKWPGISQLNQLRLPVTAMDLGFVVLSLVTIATAYGIKNSPPRKSWSLIMSLALGPHLVYIIVGLTGKSLIYMPRYFIPSAAFLCIWLALLLKKHARFELKAVWLVLYGLALVQLKSPNYPQGLSQVATAYRATNQTLVLTSPFEFVVAKYYLYPAPTLRLYDPEAPDTDYAWWPMIESKDKLQNSTEGVFITTEQQKMAKEFYQPNPELSFGEYRVYKKSNETR